jgi:undecaprenyl pyrophosphate phosphatase UppP
VTWWWSNWSSSDRSKIDLAYERLEVIAIRSIPQVVSGVHVKDVENTLLLNVVAVAVSMAIIVPVSV